MNKGLRFASDVFKNGWKKYQNDGDFQDIVETLGGAGVAATGQAIFTDMSPEEIALSTLLGGGAAFAARKPFAKGGFALGRYLDKKMPNAQDHFGMMSISSPRGREIYKRILTDIGGKSAAENDILLKVISAKGNQNYVRPDGTDRGYMEGFLGAFGRNRGDNIAQGAVALATPFLLGGNEEGEVALDSTLKM